jgi:tryptophanase
MKTLIEPFKIKSIEHIPITTVQQREKYLRDASYNMFYLHSDAVTIDMLTDSGTTAMSSKQWAQVMDGDEAYAGSSSYYKFEDTVREITGFKHILPTHQGRAAERILFSIVCGRLDEGMMTPGFERKVTEEIPVHDARVKVTAAEKVKVAKELLATFGHTDGNAAMKVIPNNTHFDTTRANIEFAHGKALDLPTDVGTKPDVEGDFKGNIDLDKLEAVIKRYGRERIPLCMLTITNNSGGGQPVSMQNIRETKRLLEKYGIPLYLDCCRYAENAWFIKQREIGYADKSIQEIAREMFSYADGATMSAKKDGLSNTGGFLATNSDELAEQARVLLIITEGYLTYGGLARRDLEALAVGFREALDENYLGYRIGQVKYFGDMLKAEGVPILVPTGGHAVYLDAKRFAPHIPPQKFPGQAISCEVYCIAGVRSVEIGSVMFGKTDAKGNFTGPAMELVRFAVPRRVYTKSHIEYTAEAIAEVYKKRENLRGMKMTYEAPFLRHFTAKFEYA